jgi:hypothetical protein
MTGKAVVGDSISRKFSRTILIDGSDVRRPWAGAFFPIAPRPDDRYNSIIIIAFRDIFYATSQAQTG